MKNSYDTALALAEAIVDRHRKDKDFSKNLGLLTLVRDHEDAVARDMVQDMEWRTEYGN